VAGLGCPRCRVSGGALRASEVRSGGSGAEVGPRGPSVHAKGAPRGVSGAWPAPQGAPRSPNPRSFMRCRGRKPRRASSGRCGRSRSSGAYPEGAREATRGAVGFDGSRPTVREGRPGRRRNGIPGSAQPVRALLLAPGTPRWRASAVEEDRGLRSIPAGIARSRERSPRRKARPGTEPLEARETPRGSSGAREGEPCGWFSRRASVARAAGSADPDRRENDHEP
jgi:hypothetical protein